MNGNGTCTLKVRQRTRRILEAQQRAFRDELITVALIDLTEAAVDAFAALPVPERKAALREVMERQQAGVGS